MTQFFWEGIPVKCYCRDILYKKDTEGQFLFTECGDNNFIQLENIPDRCESLVVVARDHLEGTLHWIVYNLPVHSEIALHEPGGRHAINDFLKHSLVIPDTDEKNKSLSVAVYALDVVLQVGGGKHGQDILRIMRNNIIGQASATCTIREVRDSNEKHTVNTSIPLGIHD
jgi:phosphatidylethanolamine-binding protein (PEBP) family uncharacterized protein